MKVTKHKYILFTGLFLDNNMDIACRSDPVICNEAHWTDPDTDGLNVEGMIERSPPLKDTVLLPAGGYVVIRFEANNPGEK